MKKAIEIRPGPIGAVRMAYRPPAGGAFAIAAFKHAKPLRATMTRDEYRVRSHGRHVHPIFRRPVVPPSARSYSSRASALPTARVLLAACLFPLAGSLAQGPLDPPGAPAPTMKTLEQVEPRTPISGLPFTISEPGSYYLTTNLTGNPGGITITASGVTLDLMGFELAGGSGNGIFVDGTRTNIAVRNGTVRGWPADGVNAINARNSQIEHIRASHNGQIGMRVGQGGFIRHGTAYGNGGEGISGGSGQVLIHDCVATENNHGITAGPNSTIRDCLSRGNTNNGFLVTGTALVLNNSSINNGTGGTPGAGIHVSGSGNRIEGNQVIGNIIGINVGVVGNLIIRNSARNNTTANYVFTGGNAVGEILDVSGGATITNANPWANFSY